MNHELQKAARRLAHENLALSKALIRQVKPEAAQVEALVSKVRELSLLVLNASETEDTLKEAIDSFDARLNESGLPWFLANYQEGSIGHLTPARRLAFCQRLIEECEAQQVMPLPLWRQIVADQGLTIEEQENT